MFDPTQKLKDAVADAMVNVLISQRRAKETVLKFNGEEVSDEPPRFLQVAQFLHEYICVGERWRTEHRVVKMVERSVRDLDLEAEATRKEPNTEDHPITVEEYLDYIQLLRSDMQNWLDQSPNTELSGE